MIIANLDIIYVVFVFLFYRGIYGEYKKYLIFDILYYLILEIE
jgi:hypothetical protein